MYRNYIDGKWEAATGVGEISIVNPADESVITVMPVSSVADAKAAIRSARRAFDTSDWPKMSPDKRAGYLRSFAEAILKRNDELVDIAVKQTGALHSLASSRQVPEAIEYAFKYAKWTAELDKDEAQAASVPRGDALSATHEIVARVPAGVVVAITPFNYPFLLNVMKIFPALGAGCTVVLKPEATTCLDAVIIAEAADEAGLPAGVLNVILGGGTDVGECLVAHRDVDVVSFTGSTPTGRRIMALAAPTVKRCLLELGGKSPHIVFADAPLEDFFATDPANLRHAGQGCGQLTRVIVERSIYDEVVNRLAERVSQLSVGSPVDPTTDVGPLANAKQYERVLSYIDIGKSEGARLVVGGEPLRDKLGGYFVQPALFADVDASMRIAQEEIFGPILVCIPFDTEDDATRIANDSIFGINGSIWTSDTEKAWRTAVEVRTGTMGINRIADRLSGPHGGFKQTGLGREFGQWSFEEYREIRKFSFTGP